MKEKIIELYKSNISIRKIAKTIDKSTSFVSSILKKEGLFNISSDLQIAAYEGSNYIAVCKKTGKEFEDFQNKSGVLTRHIHELYPDVEQPSKFKKKEYFYKTNKYWHEQFFDIKKSDKNKPIKKCPYCDWETFDLENKSGAYRTHLEKEHNLKIEDHVESYQDDKKIFKFYLDKLNAKNKFLSNENNHVKCEICGEIFYKITNSHLQNHGITLEQYKMNYSTKTMSETTKDKARNIYNKVLKNFPNSFQSKSQIEISEFIKSFGINDIENNNKKALDGTELDIYIPSMNIAIEYNGLFYHSEVSGKKDKNYHLNKLNKCKEKGIRLINIFEDEWNMKKDIVMSKLKYIFNCAELNVIHARKCVIKQIDNSEKNIFLDKNHIQGTCISSLSFGAYYNNELVSVMCFDENRNMTAHIKNDNEFELVRFCVKNEYKISGIASKLLKHFLVNYSPNKIISFADLCWTQIDSNNLYEKMGFVAEKILKPDYKYINTKISRYRRFHKFGFGKNMIKTKFPDIFSDEKTEWEMMQEAGYDRIWDCGKIRYILMSKLNT